MLRSIKIKIKSNHHNTKYQTTRQEGLFPSMLLDPIQQLVIWKTFIKRKVYSGNISWIRKIDCKRSMMSNYNLPSALVVFNVCCLLMPWTITDETVNCQKDFERQVFHMYLWMNWQKSKLKQIEVMNYQTIWIVETGKWWNRGLKSWFEWRHLGGPIKNISKIMLKE